MNSDDRQGYIDALKGWAIMGTIMVHSRLWGDGKAAQFAGAGARMCQMFFVISAFLMYGSYEKFYKKGDGRTFKSNIYWILKRFIRLIPLWYLAIIVHMLTKGWCTYWLGTSGDVSVGNILSHCFFLHGLFPYYMDSIIGVERYIGDIAILILLMPLLYRGIKSFSTAAAYIIGTNVILHWGLPYLENLNILPAEDAYIWGSYIDNFGFWNQLPVMMVGILLYRLFISIDIKKIVQNKVALSVCMLIFSAMVQYGLIYHNTKVWMLSMFTMWGLAYALWFVSQYIHSLWLINNPITRILGKYSYAIYLFHCRIVIRFYEKFNVTTGNVKNDAILKICVVTLCSLVIGMLLTEYIEKPCIKKLTNWLDRSALRY